jgi:hypothetical protein
MICIEIDVKGKERRDDRETNLVEETTSRGSDAKSPMQCECRLSPYCTPNAMQSCMNAWPLNWMRVPHGCACNGKCSFFAREARHIRLLRPMHAMASTFLAFSFHVCRDYRPIWHGLTNNFNFFCFILLNPFLKQLHGWSSFFMLSQRNGER